MEILLGELIEMLGVLDRAISLAEEPRMTACVFRAFCAEASDRNLAIVAQPCDCEA